MSLDAFEYSRKLRRLRPYDRLVLIILAGFHNSKTGQCNPSNETLARACEMNEKTVRAALKRLERAGIIGIVGSSKGGRAKSKRRIFVGPGIGKGQT